MEVEGFAGSAGSDAADTPECWKLRPRLADHARPAVWAEREVQMSGEIRIMPTVTGLPIGFGEHPKPAVDLLHHLDTWSAGSGAQIPTAAELGSRRHPLIGCPANEVSYASWVCRISSRTFRISCRYRDLCPDGL